MDPNAYALYLENIGSYLMPVVIIVFFLLIGFIVEKIAIRLLKAFLGKTKWKGDNAVIKSVRGFGVSFFLCLGLYTVLMQLHLEQNVYDMLRALLMTLIIFLVTSAASKITVAIVRLYQGRYKGMLSSISIFTNIAKLCIFTMGFLIILQTLGISITPILTALGVGGLAVALALKDSLANLFAGLHIIASGQVRAGDYIKIGTDAEGHVMDINWRSTVLKSMANNEIIIPNSKVAEAVITNYSRPQNDISVSVAVPVAYDNDFAQVQKAALSVARGIASAHPAAVASAEPSAKYSAFNDASAVLNVSVRCKTFTEQFVLKDELLKELHRKFDEDKIRIAATAV